MRGDSPKPTPEDLLNADVSHEAWAAEIARREAALLPTDVEFGPCKVSTPHAKPPDKPPATPRPGVSANPATIDARRAIKMGKRSAGGTDLDAAVLLLKAATDAASTVRLELADGTVLESAKLTPHLRKGAFIGEGGTEQPFEAIGISFWAWAKWLAANGYVGFRPGKAAWREPAAAEAAPMMATPERRKIARNDYGASDMPLVQEMKRLVDGGEASGLTAAAWAVVGKAEGRGKPEHKVKRLTGRFTATFRNSCQHVGTNG